jgi:hypothetical protein
LKQPGGGTVTIKRTTDASSAKVTVNTGTVNSDGTGGAVSTQAVGYVDLANAGDGAAGVSINDGTGLIVIFGADFKLTRNPRGYRPCSMARGGAKASEFAAMNMTIRQQWLAILNPSAVIINLEMNDRSTRTAAQMKASNATLVDATKAAVPNAGILLVTPNEPGDYASTNMPGFAAAKLALAREKGVGYYDERTVLGHYARPCRTGSWPTEMRFTPGRQATSAALRA